jgi:hypothetical protein
MNEVNIELKFLDRVPTSLEIMEKSGKLIFGHGIMEKVMELRTISENSVKIAKKCEIKTKFKI